MHAPRPRHKPLSCWSATCTVHIPSCGLTSVTSPGFGVCVSEQCLSGVCVSFDSSVAPLSTVQQPSVCFCQRFRFCFVGSKIVPRDCSSFAFYSAGVCLPASLSVPQHFSFLFFSICSFAAESFALAAPTAAFNLRPLPPFFCFTEIVWSWTHRPQSFCLMITRHHHFWSSARQTQRDEKKMNSLFFFRMGENVNSAKRSSERRAVFCCSV